LEKLRTISFSDFKISLYTGLIGGTFLSFLSHDPFKLYYIGGYLFIITIALTVFSSIFFYKKKETGTVFGKKVQVGLSAYLVTIIFSTAYQILQGQFNLKNSFEEYILLIFLHLGFGLFLSTLFIICLKGNVSSINNKP
jgi:hypothetical protein